MSHTETVLGPSEISAQRHALPLMAVHWLTALLITGAVAIVLVRDVVDIPGADRLLLDLHRAVGSGVLLLLALRIVTRVATRAPGAVEGPRTVQLAAAAVHVALYALMVAVPVAGWAATNAGGKPVLLFGLVRLPNIVGVDLDLADTLGDLHGTLAWTLVGLIAAHAAAAIWHHLIVRDDTLRRMLPLPSKTSIDRRS